MSYKAMVKTPGDQDWVGNALRFATYAEAETYGIDLASRWTLVIARETQESEDSPSHEIIDGKLGRIDG